MTALLNQLVRDAAAKDQAENELRDLRERTETFHVEVDRSTYAGLPDDLVEHFMKNEAGNRFARMLMDHPQATKRTEQDDGRRRYTIRVILEPEA